jgi:hypothetical protein
LGIDVGRLRALPIDQLEQEVLNAANEVSANVAGYDNFGQSMGLEDKADDVLGEEPEEIMAASRALVSAGLLVSPTDKITPDLKRALQAAADQKAPGLYDVMSDSKDLDEALEGVGNGSWGIGGSALQSGAGNQYSAGGSI